MMNSIQSGRKPALKFQPCKLYIKIMVRIDDPSLLEKTLLLYFTDFGPIDDIKILKNSGLKRRMQSLWVRFI